MNKVRFAAAPSALLCLLLSGGALAQAAPATTTPPPPGASPPATQAAPPPPAATGATTAGAWAPPPTATAPSPGPDATFPTFAAIPRIGLVLDGAIDGDETTQCSGTGCAANSSDDIDDSSPGLSEPSDIGLFLDLLWAVGPRDRVGLGLQGVPSYRVSVFGFSQKIGSEAQALFVYEHGVPIHGAGMLLIRGQGGLAVFFPKNDSDPCGRDSMMSEPECHHDSGPFMGPTAGVGLGYRLQGLPLRLDALYALHWYKLAHTEATNSLTVNGTTTKSTTTRDTKILGRRLWITVGYEF